MCGCVREGSYLSIYVQVGAKHAQPWPLLKPLDLQA